MNNEMSSILSAVEQGDPQAAERLLPLVYDELHKLAMQKLAGRRPARLSRPRPWCIEAYIPGLMGSQDPWLERSGSFLLGGGRGDAWHILVEDAQEETAPSRRRRAKATWRGWIWPPMCRPRTCWHSTKPWSCSHGKTPARQQLVKLRYFAGLTMADAANALRDTAENRRGATGLLARTWLHRAISLRTRVGAGLT